MAEESKAVSYTAKDIQELPDREHVRLRPGMYIGSCDEHGVHQLFEEIISNSIDEAVAGHGDRVIVKVWPAENCCEVVDFGRGVPIDAKEDGTCAATVVFTKLKAGGKFNNKVYNSSHGMNGVGGSCVNFLSETFTWKVVRDGQEARQTFNQGIPLKLPCFVASQEGQSSGTSILFTPDPEKFGDAKFNPTRIKARCKDLAMLNAGLTITFMIVEGDGAASSEKTYCFPDGVKAFVAEAGLISEVFHFRESVSHSIKDAETGKPIPAEIRVEVALQYYEDKYEENIMSYCNNGTTLHQGTHVQGFKQGLTKAINRCAEEMELLRKTKKDGVDTFQGEDIREGIKAIISITMPDPIYDSQTKTKLSNPAAASAVESLLYKHFKRFLDGHPADLKRLVKKFETARKAREAAKKARDTIRNKKDPFALSGKLMDAYSKDRKKCELFISEGSSPTSHMKEARDSEFQAILPLRGKPMNAYSEPQLVNILKNEEVASMVTAIGTGILEDFKESNLRYSKIILLGDADADGSHINCLLLGIVERLMPSLIDKGFIYLVDAPLYRLKGRKGDKIVYLKDDQELQQFKIKNPKWGVEYDVTRFKGLGEAKAEELYEHCLNPETRTLRQVTREDADQAALFFKIWLGDEAELRRDQIYENAAKVDWENFV